MDRTCSIAEARNDLSGIVRDAEAGRPVTLSRRGQPVAVLVSAQHYQRMAGQRPSLSETIQNFRTEHATALDDADWLPSRDSAPGRAPWQP